MKSRLTRLRSPHAAPPIALVLLAIVLVAASWIRFSSVSASGCPTTFSPDAWPTGGFMAVLGAFLLGGLLGTVPHPKRETSYGIRTQVGLLAAMAVITVAWFYETRALASGGAIKPITFYLMCIRSNENDWTLFVFILAALLAGRFVWHQRDAYLQ